MRSCSRVTTPKHVLHAFGPASDSLHLDLGLFVESARLLYCIDLSADFDKVGLLFDEDQCPLLSSAARDPIKAFIAVETAHSSEHPLTGTKRVHVAGSPLSLRSLSNH